LYGSELTYSSIGLIGCHDLIHLQALPLLHLACVDFLTLDERGPYSWAILLPLLLCAIEVHLREEGVLDACEGNLGLQWTQCCVLLPHYGECTGSKCVLCLTPTREDGFYGFRQELLRYLEIIGLHCDDMLCTIIA
jgi:hypothetical protein